MIILYSIGITISFQNWLKQQKVFKSAQVVFLITKGNYTLFDPFWLQERQRSKENTFYGQDVLRACSVVLTGFCKSCTQGKKVYCFSIKTNKWIEESESYPSKVLWTG